MTGSRENDAPLPLPGQGHSCHLRPHAFGQQCRIELRELARFEGSHDRRPLEQVLQIVIEVLVHCIPNYESNPDRSWPRRAGRYVWMVILRKMALSENL